MTPENFCYWLQGYYEMVGTYKLNEEQQKMVFEHHQLAFNKVTPTSIKKETPTVNNSFKIYTPPELEPQMTKICSVDIKEPNKSYEPFGKHVLPWQDKVVESNTLNGYPIICGDLNGSGGNLIIDTSPDESKRIYVSCSSTDPKSGTNTYDYVAFIGTCPLMHPTCSRNHYSRDPNNTPEEREKLLTWEKNRMFDASSQSQIKCEYEEKHGYRCVNHKHLDKIDHEEREKLLASEKSMFDNAIKITPGSEQYYRNIKCNMTC